MAESETPKAQCSQGCGKPAIAEVGGQPVCVDSFTKLQTAHAAQQMAQLQHARHNMAMMNYFEEMAWSIVPLGPPPRRIQIPQMPATGPVTFNNLKLDNSTVGAINTGNVRDIDVKLGELHAGGLDELRDAIATLTEAVASDTQASRADKDALLEQIAFLSAQAAAAAPQRKPGLIKATMGAVSAAAKMITSVANAWPACELLLKKVFGIE
jgi:hypothetical protein